MTMLISSGVYGKLLWYDVSEAASPRLLHNAKGSIGKGWKQTFFHEELHHIVYAPSANFHENRFHVAFNNLKSALQAEEVIPSVEMIQKHDNDFDDFEETIGLGNDYDESSSSNVPKGSRVLEGSESCYTGSIFDINGCGWYVGSSGKNSSYGVWTRSSLQQMFSFCLMRPSSQTQARNKQPHFQLAILAQRL
ncbi:hypothetical protein BCR33DRAFT_561133 [Rhizoclosmatium globosum]|uniref:Uncharacterized protein n=1 Tax=Rhizoclosmatium globosum TaxID=329046 RepID=A0A1Y2CST5_9FUNG|nr:hypothetical protein BCR33DRAFT_561133 [Rhizoclosmatium globosum]|eukprot:ORY50062.1 hypothetical protein BCR33DRAFT_561133 [Rhizoclosmatium globosum]